MTNKDWFLSIVCFVLGVVISVLVMLLMVPKSKTQTPLDFTQKDAKFDSIVRVGERRHDTIILLKKQLEVVKLQPIKNYIIYKNEITKIDNFTNSISRKRYIDSLYSADGPK